MSVLLTCMYVHHMRAWKPEEGIGSPGTGVTDGCEHDVMAKIKPGSFSVLNH